MLKYHEKLKPLNLNHKLNNNRIKKPNYKTYNNNSEQSRINASSTTNTSMINKKLKFLPVLNPNKINNFNPVLIKKFPKSNSTINIIKYRKKSLFDNNNIPEEEFNNTKTILAKIPNNVSNLIKKAEEIIKGRSRNHIALLSEGKYKMRDVAINLSKDISKQNYKISLIKQKHTNIDAKEQMVYRALEEYKFQYEQDYKKFLDFMEKEQKRNKSDEEVNLKFKDNMAKLEEDYDLSVLDNKALLEKLGRRLD